MIAVTREARCDCGVTKPSSVELPFFIGRGEGSKHALQTCKHCRCYPAAHLPDERGRYPSVIGDPHEFEAHGAYEFDSFYCGHGGWE